MITWTLERSGPLTGGGGWYYQTVKEVINNDGDMMQVLDVLAQQVGVIGVFSDWPATTTYYANCIDLPKLPSSLISLDKRDFGAAPGGSLQKDFPQFHPIFFSAIPNRYFAIW